MQVNVLENAQELGKAAATLAAQIINEQLATKGKARIVLSTGASQFETLAALTTMDIDWANVEMFHLDEYVDLSVQHPASFRKYLQERFVDLVPIKQVHFVNGEGDVSEHIAALTRAIRKEPIDLALIGIGENAHIAFNDPPADFASREAYMVVNLDDTCKKQQVGEGWFATINDVPRQAITMTVHQILQSNVIISSVPHKTKAHAIHAFFEHDVTNTIPATILKTHPNYTLFLDKNSASER
jgi:glucosamine-6-phosphate deaminase